MPRPSHSPAPFARARRLVGHVVLASGFLAALFVAVPPPETDAWWIPSPPVGDYSPRHVWQQHNGCVWAAGQMLLDKWTHGAVRVSQGQLRRAARGRRNGATLLDLARGVGRATGISLRFSPGYGDSMTWWQLLDRLEHDGGAVLLGEYSRLPRHFTRWNPRFASRRDSGHAVYVERYDRAHGRVWLMDPLAPGGFAGEWIRVEALRRYASLDGDRVLAAATPPRHHPTTAPLVDQAYRLGRPALAGRAIAGSGVVVRVGLTIRAGFPRPGAHRFVASWEPIVDPTAGITVGPRVVVDSRAPGAGPGPDPVAAQTASAPDRAGRGGFGGTVPVPAVAGRYRLALGLAEPGSRTPVRTLEPLEVDVLPPFAAAWQAPASLEVTAGEPFGFKVGLTNVGTLDWRPTGVPTEGPRAAVARPLQTVLVARWRSSSGEAVPAGEFPAELAPSERVERGLILVAPDDVGRWTLVLDLVNVEQGPISATGVDGAEIPVAVDPLGLAGEP